MSELSHIERLVALEQLNIQRLKEAINENPELYLVYPGTNEQIPFVNYLLMAFSGFFRDIIQSYGNYKHGEIVDLPYHEEINVKIFKNILLEYTIYTPRYTPYIVYKHLELQDLLQSIILADFYQFETLLDELITHVTPKFNTEYWLTAFHEAIKYEQTFSNKILVDRFAQVISENISNGMENECLMNLNANQLAYLLRSNYFCLPEIEIYRIAKKWEERNITGEIILIKASIRIELGRDETEIQEMRAWCGEIIHHDSTNRQRTYVVDNVSYIS